LSEYKNASKRKSRKGIQGAGFVGSFGVPLSDSRMGNREARYVDWTSRRIFILVLKGFRDTWGASGQPRQATDGSEKPEIPASAYEQPLDLAGQTRQAAAAFAALLKPLRRINWFVYP
jgi:hypothetical protein